MTDFTDKKINRLIIIGNGFDLAHKLETSFYNFLNYCAYEYLSLVFKNTCQTTVIQEELINKLHGVFHEHGTIRENDPFLGKSFYCLTDFIKEKNIKFYNELHISHVEDYLNKFDSSKKYIDFYTKLNLFEILKKEKILDDYINLEEELGFFTNNTFVSFIIKNAQSKNWNGIEQDYYEFILHLFNIEKNQKINILPEKYTITELNKEFEIVKSCLKKYLLKICKKNNFKEKSNLSDFFSNLKPEKTLILNFNYTNTVSNYLIKNKHNDFWASRIIYIHGNLNEKSTEIIFGYSAWNDEIEDKLMDKNINEIFDNHKYTLYQLESKEKSLNDFLKDTDYQVIILGHSCSSSDRTLLKKIFNHNNCSKIIQFYYSNDDFRHRSINIKRNIDNKEQYENKIQKISACPKF